MNALKTKLDTSKLRGWKQKKDFRKDSILKAIQYMRKSETHRDSRLSLLDFVENPLASDLEKRTDWHTGNLEGFSDMNFTNEKTGEVLSFS